MLFRQNIQYKEIILKVSIEERLITSPKKELEIHPTFS